MLQRVLALILKELAVLWKDPATRRVLLIPPLVQVVLFSYAATFDVTGARLAVWNEDHGIEAVELARRFSATDMFKIVAAPADPATAAKLLDAKTVAAVLHIPSTFSADVLAGRPARVQLLLDARRSNSALLLGGYAHEIVSRYAADLAPGQSPPLTLETRDWFNPTLEPKWFILPGLVAVLSLILSVLVSALSLARERELGTFDQMLVTPLRPTEIVIGKALPAMIVGLFEANVVIVAALLWFDLPMTGNPVILEGALVFFVLAGVGVGLAISSFARTQQQAILAVFIYASPAIVLSGFASPVENQQQAVQWISVLDPVRYMLVVARGIFLQDMSLDVALHAIWPMALIAAVLCSLAAVMVRRTLV